MTDREIMQQALDMLVEPHPHIRTSFTDSIKYREKINEVIPVYTALAQHEQEPVACGYDETVGMCTNNPCCEQTPVAHLWECIGRWSSYLALNGEKANLAPPEWLVDAVKAATAPPKREWVELTDDERNEMIGRIQHDQYTRQRDLINKTQIITEMYLKERNT
jgi:hypothetical protein